MSNMPVAIALALKIVISIEAVGPTIAVTYPFINGQLPVVPLYVTSESMMSEAGSDNNVDDIRITASSSRPVIMLGMPVNTAVPCLVVTVTGVGPILKGESSLNMSAIIESVIIGTCAITLVPSMIRDAAPDPCDINIRPPRTSLRTTESPTNALVENCPLEKGTPTSNSRGLAPLRPTTNDAYPVPFPNMASPVALGTLATILAPATSPLTLPIKFEDIVPAEKLPATSRLTIALFVLAEVAVVAEFDTRRGVESVTNLLLAISSPNIAFVTTAGCITVAVLSPATIPANTVVPAVTVAQSAFVGLVAANTWPIVGGGDPAIYTDPLFVARYRALVEL